MSKSVTLDEDSPLADRTVSGVAWSFAQKWAVRITGFITVAILARMLTPADFGTVAVALAVLPLTYLLADMGFSTYIVQSQSATPKMLSTAFWFSAAAGAVLCGALVAGAPLLASMFQAPDAVPVVWGLAPSVLLVTISTVPMAIMRRRMQFRRLALQSVVASLAGQVAAASLALLNFGVWALVVQTVLYQAVTAVLMWLSAEWRPQWVFSSTEFQSMAAFGVKVVGVDLVAQLRYWLESAILANALGVAGLGFISVAQRLVQIAQDSTAAAVLPVSTVAFAQVRREQERLRSGYLRALGLCLATVVPVMIFLAVSAPALLPLLFGSQWQASVGPSQVLALAGVFTVIAMLDHALFYGVGKPGVWLLYGIAVDVLTVLVALVAAPHGAMAWALGFLTVAVVASVARFPMVGRQIVSPWYKVGAVLVRAVILGIVQALVGVAVLNLIGLQNDILVVCAVATTIGVVHLIGMQVLMRAEWHDARGLISGRLTRLREAWTSSRRRSANRSKLWPKSSTG